MATTRPCCSTMTSFRTDDDAAGRRQKHSPLGMAKGGRRETPGIPDRKCYIVTKDGTPMPTELHSHQHHHHAGQGHPPATVRPSILRLSVVERLAAAGVGIAVIWAVVAWAMAQ